jgi:hypothetical protein
MISSRYRYAVDCGSPKPAPSRGISPLSRNHASPNRACFMAGQPAGSLPGADLAAVRGQQGGREPDQFSGDVEHDTIGDHAEPLPVDGDLQRDLFYRGLRACQLISGYVRVSVRIPNFSQCDRLTLGEKTSLPRRRRPDVSARLR